MNIKALYLVGIVLVALGLVGHIFGGGSVNGGTMLAFSGSFALLALLVWEEARS